MLHESRRTMTFFPLQNTKNLAMSIPSPLTHWCFPFCLSLRQKSRCRKNFPTRLKNRRWSEGESNPWPQHCERCALPTELPPRIFPSSTLNLKDVYEYNPFPEFVKGGIRKFSKNSQFSSKFYTLSQPSELLRLLLQLVPPCVERLQLPLNLFRFPCCFQEIRLVALIVTRFRKPSVQLFHPIF